MFELAGGDYLKKKKIEKENMHELLFHLNMKTAHAKAVRSAYDNKNTIEL